MTFSIVGFCEETGMSGVAITTSSIAVGSRCPWVRAKVGAVTTQNVTDPSIGNEVLDQMERGLSPSKAIDKVLEIRDNIEYRQVAAVDSNGKTASFTGKNILGKNSVSTGKSCIAAGNLLLKESLTQEMVSNFENNKTIHLAERLILDFSKCIAISSKLSKCPETNITLSLFVLILLSLKTLFLQKMFQLEMYREIILT